MRYISCVREYVQKEMFLNCRIKMSLKSRRHVNNIWSDWVILDISPPENPKVTSGRNTCYQFTSTSHCSRCASLYVRRGLRCSEIEWIQMEEIRKIESVAVAKHVKLYPNPCSSLKKSNKSWWLWILSRRNLNFCVRSTPLRGGGGWTCMQPGVRTIKHHIVMLELSWSESGDGHAMRTYTVSQERYTFSFREGKKKKKKKIMADRLRFAR